MPNKLVCGGTVVSTKMNSLLSHVQKAWCHSTSTPTTPSAGTVPPLPTSKIHESNTGVCGSGVQPLSPPPLKREEALVIIAFPGLGALPDRNKVEDSCVFEMDVGWTSECALVTVGKTKTHCMCVCCTEGVGGYTWLSTRVRNVFMGIFDHSSGRPLSFPSDEGWPFAKYLGACGRMVAVNYVGEELWSFYHAPWEKRVDLAKQLMDIAEQLTNNDFDFALYLLDVSFDNFAVGPRDGKVIVVDAENVVVADKRLIKQNKPESYDVWYESKFEECDKEACLSFSKDMLCSRVTVDHNYYAICQNLLSRYATWRGSRGGLLHDPPAHIAKDGQLEAMLEECANPKKRYGRFTAAKELREYLTQLSGTAR
ncbi:hypothetical protein NFI96_020758 [Prochilodus magdalenae]|nr:hypothetical protein NFI96_020758 [Prochilodus magdalenae]